MITVSCRASGQQKTIVLALAAITILPLAVGCGRKKNYLNENDKLRRRNMELDQQVRDLEQTIDRRVAQIEVLEQQIGGSAAPSADAPKLTQLKFDRYSGALDGDEDGRDDTIRIYLRTIDQHGRFVPVAAVVSVQANHLAIDQPPRRIVDKTYQPDEFNQTYRSGFMGTHYTLELPLPESMPNDIDRVDVSVLVSDAATGATMAYTRTIAIQTKLATASP